MREKVVTAVGAGALTLVLSSCWALQNFTIGDYTLTPGQATKAKLRACARRRRHRAAPVSSSSSV